MPFTVETVSTVFTIFLHLPELYILSIERD